MAVMPPDRTLPRPADAGGNGAENLSAAEAAWPFNPDSPHVAEILAAGSQVRVLLVDVAGLEWAEIADRLEFVRETAREKELVPVFLTDTLDFAGFRAAGVVYDTLPNAAALAELMPGLEWQLYLDSRRRHAAEKWRPAATVRLGPTGNGESE